MHQESMFSGDLIGVTFQCWLVPHDGWCLRVTRTYEYQAPGALQSEKYDRLSRGELLDVLDAVRAALDVGLEYR